jgi:hypothetical protein
MLIRIRFSIAILIATDTRNPARPEHIKRGMPGTGSDVPEFLKGFSGGEKPLFRHEWYQARRAQGFQFV